MNQRQIITLSAITALGLALLPRSVVAQQGTLKQQLVGTWTLLLDDGIRADGTHVPRFGANPIGTVIFAADGHYSLQIMRVDHPAFAADNRLKGIAGDNNPQAAGLLTHFGTYVVTDSDKTLFFHIEASSSPNLIGSRKGRPITAITDELLTWDDPPPPTSEYADATVAWKKVK
jgi:hypothetical protein